MSEQPGRGPGQGSAQTLRVWRSLGFSALFQTEASPWGLDPEPGQLNENQAMSGLRKKMSWAFGKYL